MTIRESIPGNPIQGTRDRPPPLSDRRYAGAQGAALEIPPQLYGYYVHQWFYNGPTLVHTHLLYGNCRVTSDCIPYTDKTPSRHVPQPSITAKIQSNCNHRAHPFFSLPALPSCFVDPPLSSNFKFFSFPSWALNDFISKRAPPFCQRCLHQYQWVFYILQFWTRALTSAQGWIP